MILNCKNLGIVVEKLVSQAGYALFQDFLHIKGNIPLGNIQGFPRSRIQRCSTYSSASVRRRNNISPLAQATTPAFHVLFTFTVTPFSLPVPSLNQDSQCLFSFCLAQGPEGHARPSSGESTQCQHFSGANLIHLHGKFVIITIFYRKEFYSL